MKQTSNFFIVAIAVGILIPLVLLLAVAALNLEGENGGPSAPLQGKSANTLLNTPAPAFSLRDQQGETISSTALSGKKAILFFNEGLRCYPACWNAMVALAQDERFQRDGMQAFSVVVDSEDEWRRASEKVSELQKVHVLFDTDRVVSSAFGMLSLPSSMHRGSLPGHTYVLLDESGVIRWIFDDPRMGIRNDEIARELSKLGR